MKKLYATILAVLCASAAFAQQDQIFYSFSFPNVAHHEAEVSMRVSNAPSGALRFRMSRSSPGRYATHEFGKNVYNVKAFGINNEPLTVNQVAGDLWEIPHHDESVKITYTLYGNWTDGTYVSIDPSHAHLNMPATIMWVYGTENRPIRLQFQDLDKYGWKVATQLRRESATDYYAPDLQYLMDSPTELSNYKEYGWNVVNTDGKTEHIHLTTHSADDQGVIDNYGKMVQRLVLEEKAIFGELPTYDFGDYTFLQDVDATVSGDGMEHRNSTCITQPAPKVAGYEKALIGTFAHEYFHSWNVERIRPKTLEPFNFEHANMSNELWFAEGFTQYYGELLPCRAGISSVDDYVDEITGLVNAVLNTPGAKNESPIQSSRYAVFADAGVAIDPTNMANIFTSYYYYGGATALALDLRLRSQFNMTLDDFMRQVWLTYGKNEQPYVIQKPYTIADLQATLARVTKNPAFAADFFKRYIYGTEKNDYAALLDKAGLVLRKANSGKGWIGRIGGMAQRGRTGQARTNGEGYAITSNTVQGTPLYDAGIDAGDVILTADGTSIKDGAALAEVVAAKHPGDKIKLTYRNRTGEHEAEVSLKEDPTLEIVTYEKAGKTLTKDQEAFRNSWLSTKVK
jgi:predicted metalloprotease with PDZ domain